MYLVLLNPYIQYVILRWLLLIKISASPKAIFSLDSYSHPLVINQITVLEDLTYFYIQSFSRHSCS